MDRQLLARRVPVEIVHGKRVWQSRLQLAVAGIPDPSAAILGARRQAFQQRDIAARNLANTVARAPFAGSVAERLADEGTLASHQPQTIVVVLQETTVLEARVPIPETQMGRVHAGDAARLFAIDAEGALRGPGSPARAGSCRGGAGR